MEFSPESSSVLQLVCRVDLGGSFRPDVRAVLDHSQLRTFAIDTRDGVAVRIPHIQEAPGSQSHSSSAAETEDNLGELADGFAGTHTSLPSYSFRLRELLVRKARYEGRIAVVTA